MQKQPPPPFGKEIRNHSLSGVYIYV